MWTCALLLAGLSPGFAPAPFPKPDSIKEQQKKLHGEWARVDYIVSGKKMAVTPLTTIVITDDKIKYNGPALSTNLWLMLLDANKKPKILDMKGLVGAEKGVTYWGIYRLEGDVLTILGFKGVDASARAKGFEDAAKPGSVLEVFERQKR